MILLVISLRMPISFFFLPAEIATDLLILLLVLRRRQRRCSLYGQDFHDFLSPSPIKQSVIIYSFEFPCQSLSVSLRILKTFIFILSLVCLTCPPSLFRLNFLKVGTILLTLLISVALCIVLFS